VEESPPVTNKSLKTTTIIIELWWLLRIIKVTSPRNGLTIVTTWRMHSLRISSKQMMAHVNSEENLHNQEWLCGNLICLTKVIRIMITGTIFSKQTWVNLSTKKNHIILHSKVAEKIQGRKTHSNYKSLALSYPHLAVRLASLQTRLIMLCLWVFN